MLILAIKAVKVELNGSLKIMSETELSELVEQTSDESYIPSEKILPHGNLLENLSIFLNCI